jgi:hypothetical protein
VYFSMSVNFITSEKKTPIDADKSLMKKFSKLIKAG